MATTIKTTAMNGNSVNNNDIVSIFIKGAESVEIHRGGDQKNAALSRLMEMAGENPEMLKLIRQLTGQIEEGGYMDVEGIVRRWIPSQCLHMQYSMSGFHDLLACRGIKYSWKVLYADLKRQNRMLAQNDTEGYEDRNRWYNKEVAFEMAQDYVSKLSLYAKSLMNHDVHRCKGVEYIPLRCELHAGHGVFLNEVPAFINKFQVCSNRINKAKNMKALIEAVEDFMALVNSVHDQFEMSKGFMNVYKAVGAYYTMKDLILFERCHFYGSTNNRDEVVEFDTDESLSILEALANDMVERKDVLTGGYKLLGALRLFLDNNHFDFEATKQEWKKQSAKRRAERMMVSRNNRRARK